jgi:hypothetical protein
MVFVPGFLADIFVSYSHIDNEPFGVNETRWVSQFHHYLEIRVRQLGLPATTTIWRDNKTGGTDIFSDETLQQLRHSAILVSIVTPAYLQSDWCKRELDEFIEAAGQTGGVRIGNKTRIVKVLKTLVERSKLPAILDTMLGYQFYAIEPESESVREFLIDPSPKGGAAYFARIDDVALEVKRLIDLLAPRSTPSNPLPQPRTAVYLAVPSSDAQGHNDQLRRELDDRGLLVLPEKPLPLTADQIVESVRQDIGRSALSIHALGARYGFIPEGETRSIVEIQYDIGKQRADGNFTCAIWIPRGLNPVEGRQRELIERVQTQRSKKADIEVLETSLEELKTFVVDRLRRRSMAEATAKPAMNGDGSRHHTRVYLVYDKLDRETVAPLRTHLDAQGFEILQPVMKGEPKQIRELHEDYLRLADGVLLYWGVADEFWLKSKVNDLLRIRGLGRTEPFRASAVYLADPQVEEKQDFVTQEAAVIRHFGAFLPEALGPFVTQLSATSK